MLNLIATSAFGLEAVVKYELEKLGYEAQIVSPGKIRFQAEAAGVARTNLWLRSADRIQIEIDRFPARDFDALFETTKSLPWHDWIPAAGQFPVVGRSRNSQLSSVPAIQRAVKRAVVDQLKSQHKISELPETDALYKIEISLLNDEATLTLDTTGPSLHKRGYRTLTGQAPLKETMAAALVQLSFWSSDLALIHPFCGIGTIPIEAALIGRNMAPGLKRTFVGESWPALSNQHWQRAREEAESVIVEHHGSRLVGYDIDRNSIRMARYHAQRAGVEDDVHFQEKPFQEIASPHEHGCVITNPPYGQRIGEVREMQELYRSIPEVLRRLPTWSHFILTAFPNFERFIQKEANRRRKLYNGRIECTFFQFHGPRPASRHTGNAATQNDTAAGTQFVRPPVFGGLPKKAQQQADLLCARLAKRARHLRKWPSKQDIHCFRIYERDVPEIPLIIDRYEDHLHVTECERPHDRDIAQHAEWIELMVESAAEILEIDREKVFLKRRIRQRGSLQHERVSDKSHEITVKEGGLQFFVNLSDYVDTGLFLDHRVTRSMVRDAAQGARVLNLFAYTGAFSVYAADGAAAEVTSVDWSNTYIAWSERNMALNRFEGPQYKFHRSDVQSYLDALDDEQRFDLIVVDPPTFSNSKRSEKDWQIQQDYAAVLNSALDHLAAEGCLFFSTNFRGFKFDEQLISASNFREISRQTVPPDFRNRRIHRCWIIRK